MWRLNVRARGPHILHQRRSAALPGPGGLICCAGVQRRSVSLAREQGSSVRRAILTTGGQWVVTALVMVGLLLTPVSCTLVDHPHSLFDTPDALERSGQAAHAGHTRVGHAAHAMTMVNGAPPLAAAVPLPELHPGTVMAWLAGNAIPGADDGVAVIPGLATLPSVSAASMTMVASGLSALNVALLLLLAVTLITRRPLIEIPALLGRAVATIAPPPRRPTTI